jgi:mannose-1-phosphate guanylyltransferase
LGTWGSLDTHLTHDERGNALIGDKVHAFNTSNSIINLENGTEAIIDGLDGYIVIQSENRLMILKKENEQELKQFMKEL